MKFRPLTIPGAFAIEPEAVEDSRGFFARVWCERELEAHQLSTSIAQASISFNKKKGTLRGIHFQHQPFSENKIVRCTMGCLFDVVVDLRQGSPTFARHEAVVLSSTNRTMVYVPEGCGHAFQTLEDNTEVFYCISAFYHPEAAGGIRWNDPTIGIEWPCHDPIISERDQSLPCLSQATGR
jgi:dTDP-4-dehydrorhamnose 3,5-epimerase